jgi:hypothetical protein
MLSSALLPDTIPEYLPHPMEESEIEGNNKSKIGEPTLTSFYFHISETGDESPPKLKICLPARPKPQGSRVMGEGTIPTKYGKWKYNETSGDSDSSGALKSPPKPKLHVHRMKSKKADGNQNSRRPSKVTEEPPRKRGRPRKVIIASDDDLPVVVPKKRGRPAKTVEDPRTRNFTVPVYVEVAQPAVLKRGKICNMVLGTISP